MIVNKYQGNGGGGGGSYVLPAATSETLGGIKVGSGLTITNDGTLSSASDFNKLMAVNELPESAETGDVVALSSETGESITFNVSDVVFGEGEDILEISGDGLHTLTVNAFYDSENQVNVLKLTNSFDEEYLVEDGSSAMFPASTDSEVMWTWRADLNNGVVTIKLYDEDNEAYLPLSTSNISLNVCDAKVNGTFVGVYQYDGSAWNEIGGEGGSGVIHLDSLPSEGEEGLTYEYNGRLFRYETTPENWGRWIGAVQDYASTTGLGNDGEKNLILAYSVIPSGTVLGDVYDFNTFLVRLVYDGLQILGYDNTEMTGTPVGQVSIGGYTSFGDVGAHRFVRVSWVDGQINFYIPVYTGFRNRADITANKTNWVAFDMDGGNAYPIIDMGTSDTTEDFGIPTWNKEGIIIQKNGNVSISYKRINNNAYNNTIKLYTSEVNNNWESWFIPTQPGTAGQVLTSAGNAEPQWATIIKAQQITSAAYEALVTKDPNTLYLIVDE